jgi:hypothetical protein
MKKGVQCCEKSKRVVHDEDSRLIEHEFHAAGRPSAVLLGVLSRTLQKVMKSSLKSFASSIFH